MTTDECLDAEGSTTKRRRRDAYGLPLERSFLDNFAADFHSFLDGVSMRPDLKQLRRQRKMTAEERYAADAPHVAGVGRELYESQEAKKHWLRQLPHLQYADYVLAAAIAAVFGHWTPPLNGWKLKDAVNGCKFFRRHCGRLKYAQFCDLLDLKSFFDCDMVFAQRLLKVRQLTTAWAQLQSLEFYDHPARFMLTRWIANVIELVDR